MAVSGTIPFIANVVLWCIWMLFFSLVLEPRFKLWINIACYIGLFFLWYYVAAILPYASLVRMLYNPVFLLIAVLVLFKDRWMRSAFAAIVATAAMFVGELATIALTMAMADPDLLAPGSVNFLSERMQLGMYAIYIPLIALLLWLASLLFNRYKNRLAMREWLLYALFPASQFLFIILWFETAMQEEPADTVPLLLAATVVSFVADAALYIAVRGMAQRTELRVQNAMLEDQINAQKEHYVALTEQYERVRYMRHDIANHVHTIQILLENGRPDDAAAYAAEIAPQHEFHPSLGECEHPIVDAFLFSRLEDAKQRNIRISADVALPYDLPVSNADLVCAFGNLLDNAVEACDSQTDPDLSVRARVDKGCLIIVTENSLEQKQPRHSKSDRSRPSRPERGIGFHILEDMVKQYDGTFQAGEQDGRFISTLILRLDAKGEAE